MPVGDSRGSLDRAKYEAILAAGRDLFLAQGFTRTAMADVAGNADVSTATLYKHFASKEALFAAVVKEAARSVSIYEDVLAGDPDAAEALRRAARIYLAAQFEGRLNDLFRIVLSESRSAPSLAAETFEIVATRRYESFGVILDRLIARGRLKPHDTMESAILASGMIKEIFVWPALFKPSYKLPNDTEHKIAAIVEIFLARYGA